MDDDERSAGDDPPVAVVGKSGDGEDVEAGGGLRKRAVGATASWNSDKMGGGGGEGRSGSSLLSSSLTSSDGSKKKKGRKGELKGFQKLLTDKRVYNMSLWAMRLGVLADSVNNTILRPNYPFMVLPDTPGSFPNTEPFSFSAAQYFIPMTSLLGTAIAATFVGTLSDKIGRRPVMIVCVGFGVVGSIAKYFARSSFWAFCGCNFITGLFGATLAVSMAYASDVAHTRSEKDAVIGSLVGISMVGATGGGIITIAMSNVGLFEPLLVGAGLNFVAALFAYFFLVEPNKMLMKGTVIGHVGEDDDDDVDEDFDEEGGGGGGGGGAPSSLDWKVCNNILIGSLLDNAGSTGFIPFCLSPLAFTAFLSDFVARGMEPLMTDNAFRWLSTLLALMIIPAAASSNRIYEKIGAAGGCVLGNFLTGIMTIVLLQIAQITPATTATYIIYFALMYIGFPFTVISQLSTGPMLDRISPPDRKGFIQGLNSTVMQFGQALSPWVFGIIADSIGIITTIWICVGISFLAAAVNAPLMFVSVLKPRGRVLPEYSRRIKGEDKEIVEKALRGSWVPLIDLWEANDQRMNSGHGFLVLPIRPYKEDADRTGDRGCGGDCKGLCEMKRHAKEDFRFLADRMTGYLGEDWMTTDEGRAEIAELIRRAKAPPEKQTELKEHLGKWFGDYMEDAGYQLDHSPFIFKQLIMSAFPRVMKPGETEITAENIEQVTLNMARIYKHYLEEEDNSRWIKAFAQAYGA